MSDGHSAPDKLTLIVVPDEASPVRRYQISRVWLRRARWIGPLLAVMLLALIGDYTRLRFNAVDMERLRGEAEERQVRVEALAEAVEDLDGQLTRIRELERKVRIIANLPEVPSQEAVPAGAPPTALPGSGATAKTSVETAAPKRKAKPAARKKAAPAPKKKAKSAPAKAKPAPKPAKPKAKPAPKSAETKTKPAAPKAKPAPKLPATTKAPPKPAPKSAPTPAPKPRSVAKPSPPQPAPKTSPEDLGVPKPGEKPPQHLVIPREEAPRVPAAPLDGQGGPETDAPAPGDEVPFEDVSELEEAPAADRMPEPEGGEAVDDEVTGILGSSAIREQLEIDADLLAIELSARVRSLDELLERLEGKSAQLASTPSIWPTSGWVTSPYGYRTSPFTNRRQFHSGLDIAAKFGTPVVAPATGRVLFAGRKGPMGKMVEIDHGHGISTAYGHLAEYFVKKGEFVERGQRIAAVGSTGRSTGPHLHYVVRVKRKHVNPSNYIID